MGGVGWGVGWGEWMNGHLNHAAAFHLQKSCGRACVCPHRGIPTHQTHAHPPVFIPHPPSPTPHPPPHPHAEPPAQAAAPAGPIDWTSEGGRMLGEIIEGAVWSLVMLQVGAERSVPMATLAAALDASMQVCVYGGGGGCGAFGGVVVPAGLGPGCVPAVPVVGLWCG